MNAVTHVSQYKYSTMTLEWRKAVQSPQTSLRTEHGYRDGRSLVEGRGSIVVVVVVKERWRKTKARQGRTRHRQRLPRPQSRHAVMARGCMDGRMMMAEAGSSVPVAEGVRELRER